MKELLFTLTLILSASSYARGGQGQDSGRREAMDACASELGISKPERGTRPSQEDREAIDKCMSSKGYERPSGPPPQGHRGNDQEEY